MSFKFDVRGHRDKYLEKSGVKKESLAAERVEEESFSFSLPFKTEYI